MGAIQALSSAQLNFAQLHTFTSSSSTVPQFLPQFLNLASASKDNIVAVKSSCQPAFFLQIF